LAFSVASSATDRIDRARLLGEEFRAHLDMPRLADHLAGGMELPADSLTGVGELAAEA